jgi:hypothetical protein
MATTRGRLVHNNLVVYDQADFFQLDGFTRVPGLTPLQLQCLVFYNNSLLPWPLISGTGLTEGQVGSGNIYWDTLGSGSYGVRWRPNAVGYWRILLTYTPGAQVMGQDYDVQSGTGVVPPGGGLRSSFIGSGGRNDP